MASVPNGFHGFYPKQTSPAPQNPPDSTLDHIDADSSPFFSNLGYYLSLPALLDATTPLQTTLEATSTLPYGGNVNSPYPSPLVDAPSVSAAAYNGVPSFNIPGSGVGDQLTAISSSEDEPSLATTSVDTLAAPEAPPSQKNRGDPQAAPPVLGEPSTTSSHAYRRLPAADEKSVDKHLRACMVAEKKAYKCVWPNCPKKPFKRRCNARTHVHKHLGDPKLFECVACLAQFASEDAARRHCSSQIKTFSCKYCSKSFARKDHRNVHQRASCSMQSLALPGHSSE